MKSNIIKQLAVKGLVNGKLKLGRVRPKSFGFFWNKGVTMYGALRPVMMSVLELKLVYNKDNFIELPAVWDGKAEQCEEDNTFLLNTATTYYINIAEGYILIDNRKYKFELEDVSLRLDVDGDWVSTHVESKNLVCYANTSIGTIIYKEIKILGEL